MWLLIGGTQSWFSITIVFHYTGAQCHVVVPDELVEELVDLRVAFAKLLRNYEKELRNSPEAQDEFVALLPGLFRKGGSCSNPDFKSNFDKLIEERVSLFNTHYLKSICSIFPEDVW